MDQFILGAHLGLFLKLLGSLISKQAQFVSKFQESDTEAEQGVDPLTPRGHPQRKQSFLRTAPKILPTTFFDDLNPY